MLATMVAVLALAGSASASYRDIVAGTPGGVGYWRLGEAAGSTTASDELARNPGAYSGVTLGASGLLSGDSNTAGTFTSTGHVQVADSTSLHLSGSFSLETWIKESSAPTTRSFNIIAKTNSYYLALRATNTLQIGFVSGGVYKTLNAPSPITTGTRYHVVGTYNGSSLKLYVNGAQVAPNAQSGSVDVNALPLQLSTWSGTGDGFPGVIDEPAVYNQALSSNTVYSHWLAGSVRGPSPGLASQTTWGDETAAQQNKEVSLASQAGAKWARVSAGWDGIEQAQGVYHQAEVDALDNAISQYRGAGIQIVMLIDAVPCWASADPAKNCTTGSWNHYYGPPTTATSRTSSRTSPTATKARACTCTRSGTSPTSRGSGRRRPPHRPRGSLNTCRCCKRPHPPRERLTRRRWS